MDKLLKQLLWVGACLFALAGQALADPLLDAHRVYETGDYEQAAKLYGALAEKGNAEAQYILGVMHRAGRGVSRDVGAASKWYLRAAEQGHALAQFNLGWMYAGGKGVEQDAVKAQMWFEIAIANAKGEARKEFAVDRDALAQSMSADQVASARALAKKCMAKKFKGC